MNNTKCLFYTLIYFLKLQNLKKLNKFNPPKHRWTLHDIFKEKGPKQFLPITKKKKLKRRKKIRSPPMLPKMFY